MNRLPPAIVLGVDSPIGLTVMRELGGHGVPVIAIGRTPRALGRFSRYAARFHVRPPGVPLAGWLPDFIVASGASVLLAVGESDLLDLSQLAARIAGCHILTPRAGPLAVVLDKRRTLAAAAAIGIDVPPSWQPRPGDDFTVNAAAFDGPSILKWADPPAAHGPLSAAGLAFEKVEQCTGPAALLAALHRYDRLGQWPMVQAWCPGHGLGQMLMMDGDRATLRFQHRRIREYPATGGVSTLCASVPTGPHAAQMARSEALLTAIGWQGPAMVEYRHDPTTGRYWLMEVNGRFWGSLPLAHRSGAEFAWAHYRAALGIAGVNHPYRRRRARYAGPDVKRLASVLRMPVGRARLAELVAFALEYLNPRTRYYVWRWSDPLPFLADLVTMLARRCRGNAP